MIDLANWKPTAFEKEVINLAMAEMRPRDIHARITATGRSHIKIHSINQTLYRARKAGYAIPSFEGLTRAAGPKRDRPERAIEYRKPENTPPRMAAPVGLLARHVDERISAAEYGSKLTALVMRGMTVTGLAALLHKPYRTIISDMERLGLSRVKT